MSVFTLKKEKHENDLATNAYRSTVSINNCLFYNTITICVLKITPLKL